MTESFSLVPSIPGLFTLSSLEMEATENKSDCYNDKTFLLGMFMEATEIKKGCSNAALHLLALHRILFGKEASEIKKAVTMLSSIPWLFTVSYRAMQATEINLTVTMIELASLLPSILGLSMQCHLLLNGN